MFIDSFKSRILKLFIHSNILSFIYNDVWRRKSKVFWGPAQSWRHIGDMEIEIKTFLTLVLDRSEWSASCSNCATSGERSLRIQWIGEWVGQSAGLDKVMRKILSLPGTIPQSILYPVTLLIYPSAYPHLCLYLSKWRLE
jgi:hypothetical protein